MQGGNKGLRRGIKGTQAEEENKRLRGEIKGADSATESNKMHEGENKMCNG